MSGGTVVKLAKDESNKERMLEHLRKTIADIEAGKTVRLVTITDIGEQYTYARFGFTYEQAIGIFSRAQHCLNVDWDREVRQG